MHCLLYMIEVIVCLFLGYPGSAGYLFCRKGPGFENFDYLPAYGLMPFRRDRWLSLSLSQAIIPCPDITGERIDSQINRPAFSSIPELIHI